MTLFRYRILSDGALARGEIEAASPQEAVLQLQKRGAMVLGLTPARGGRLLSIGAGGPALRRSELAEVMRELTSLLGAGQDLDAALRLAAEEAPSRRVAAVMRRVHDSVRSGSALAIAMQREPKSFPRLCIGLVRAGEAGGDLAGTLARLADLLERQRSLAANLQAAMIYPAVLLVAAGGSIVLLLTQVLPQFVPLFAENGVALPASTAFLLGLGQAVADYGIYALITLVALAILVNRLLQRPGARLVADRLFLRLPIIGSLAREVVAARFARTLGMLLINGVPLLAALSVTEDVLGNLAARTAVKAAAETAKTGHGMTRALAAAGLFPPRLLHLLRLGEETAQLGPLALRGADMLEERTRLGLQRLVALLVPAITILMGAAVAGIISSLLLAMLSLNDIAQ
ncbi:MAG TPA: type II secretion system F family protein [Acidisoma sp.]|uniref:type II secretion system F family protein n=1 Tax=Acidisoma sp. TaxID=1872115 RepID=UPI002BA6599F|nr:type II secretion system F family protein [Acidisoma sp.]HTH99922.1 type II secretion system F family protein [Acidisoma sp.]